MGEFSAHEAVITVEVIGEEGMDYVGKYDNEIIIVDATSADIEDLPLGKEVTLAGCWYKPDEKNTFLVTEVLMIK